MPLPAVTPGRGLTGAPTPNDIIFSSDSAGLCTTNELPAAPAGSVFFFYRRAVAHQPPQSSPGTASNFKKPWPRLHQRVSVRGLAAYFAVFGINRSLVSGPLGTGPRLFRLCEHSNNASSLAGWLGACQTKLRV